MNTGQAQNLTPGQQAAIAHVRRALAEATQLRTFEDAAAQAVKYELVLQQVAGAFPEGGQE